VNGPKLGSARLSALIEGGEERGRSCVVTEGFTEVGKAIDISRREDEAAAKLKGIRAKFVLLMAGRAGALAAFEIIATSEVQQIGGGQVSDRVSLALFVDQQRKIDARLLAENARVVAVTKADGRERSTFVQECLLVFAQLRDVLTAKNSSIVAQKNNHGRLALPQRTQPNFFPIGVRKNQIRKPLAQSFAHVKHH
jgi:hypothetical protein